MSKYEKPVMLVMEEEGAREIAKLLDAIVNDDSGFHYITADEFNILSNFTEALKSKLDIL